MKVAYLILTVAKERNYKLTVTKETKAIKAETRLKKP